MHDICYAEGRKMKKIFFRRKEMRHMSSCLDKIRNQLKLMTEEEKDAWFLSQMKLLTATEQENYYKSMCELCREVIQGKRKGA